jgi:DNA repair photolyase
MCEHTFVRWDELKVEAEEERRLPGYSDGAVVRRFDAPEALDTRFYEVHAKSALNRVPEQSQMPFRWTINPYRGCSHACVYCLAGDTPILMADGRTKALEDVRPGDAIYGTVRERFYRRYVITEVRDHWSTTKPAYRVELEDGTELITSGDHRFLTHRGWKHVVGSGPGRAQRPYLTVNDRMLGVGAFASPPEDSPGYRRGYVCGMVRGDSRLLCDPAAMQRLIDYMHEPAAVLERLDFVATAGAAVPMGAFDDPPDDDHVDEMVEWPRAAGEDWCKGFLAGMFDAQGSNSRSGLSISNEDPELLEWIGWCFWRLRFRTVTDDHGRASGRRSVRLLGGVRERLRFMHTMDPATPSKSNLGGLTVKSDARLRVASIEPLGMEMPLFDISTGTGDFIANGVVSHNCFARPTHKFLDMNAGRDFEREIVVKVNVPEVLRGELKRPSWKGEHVALGTNTDPYQWVEGRYKLMPAIWEAFRDFRNPCSVLTKSPLLLRDLPLMKEIAAVTSFTASLSIPTLDEKAWRATEPHTPNPRARIEAVAELNRQGIPCGVLVAPLMPGINDSPEQVERILTLCAEAGAVHIGGIALHLRGEVRGIFMDWLRSQRPDLVPRYEQLYARGAYAPKAERARLSTLVWKGKSKLAGYVRERPNMRWRPEDPPAAAKPEPVPPPQPSLF